MKNILNIFLLVTAIFSALSSLLKLLIQFKGFRENYPDYSKSLDLIDIPNLNWGAIYLLLCITCVICLVVFNYEFIKDVIKKIIKSRVIEWDMPFTEAMDYLKYESNLGKAWLDGKKDFLAAETLKEAVEAKKLPVAGTSEGSYSLKQVVMAKHTVENYFYNGRYVRTFVIAADKTSSIENLFFDKKHVQKLWKSKYSDY